MEMSTREMDVDEFTLKQDVISSICDFLCNVICMGREDIELINSAETIALQPGKLFTHLQELIVQLRKLENESRSNSSNSRLSRENRPNLINRHELPIPISDPEKDVLLVTDSSYCKNGVTSESYFLKPTSSNLNENSVQIKASKCEIDRRIASYMTKKQEEVNEFNKREFSIGRASDHDSCARTESVFTPQAGSRSHIKITKVVNSFGPQTQVPCTNDAQTESISIKQEFATSASIEERIKDIETHTNMRNNSKDIYIRLKAIEERILFLESLSPEYFNQISNSSWSYRKRKADISACTHSNIDDDSLSLIDIDSKIQTLQESLKKKQCLSDFKSDK